MDIEQIVELAQRVHDRERMNFGAGSSRDRRNEQWERIIGLVHHGSIEYGVAPDPRWHIKSAGNGRPQSDDVVVLMPSRDFWDCIPGAGADGYSFRANYDGILPAEQHVYAPRVPKEGAVTTPPATPLWQAEHTALLAKLQQRFDPVTQIGDSAYIQICAEQFAYSFPQEGWGRKAGDPTRPVSNHSIARQTTTGLVGFRIVPDVAVPTPDDIRGQHFVQVAAVNHLGIEITPPPPVDVPVDPVPPLIPDLAELAAALSQRLSALDQAVASTRLQVGTEGQLLRQQLGGQKYDIRGTVSWSGIRAEMTPKPFALPDVDPSA